MLNSWRDIAVFLDASEEGERIGRYAASIAQQHRAHLVALYDMPHTALHPSESHARGMEAVGEVIRRQQEADTANALVAAGRVRALANEFGIASEFRVVWHDGLSDEVALKALSCDLIVAATPRPRNLPANWSAENLLLTTGIPVVMVPADWPGDRIASKVVIAWNRSREARRAVNDALPFIGQADAVSILTVDGERQMDDRSEDPGMLLAEHLSRHGIAADVIDVPSAGRPIADVLFHQASELQADLMVMGAYSRPRRQELLFGGTTRAILARTPIPTLMSR